MSEKQYEQKEVLRTFTNLAVTFTKVFNECKTYQGKFGLGYVTTVRLCHDYDKMKKDQEVTLFPTENVANAMDAYPKGAMFELVKKEFVNPEGKMYKKFELSHVDSTGSRIQLISAEQQPPSPEKKKEEPQQQFVNKMTGEHVQTVLTQDQSESLTKVINWSLESGSTLELQQFAVKWLQKYPTSNQKEVESVYKVYNDTIRSAKGGN